MLLGKKSRKVKVYIRVYWEKMTSSICCIYQWLRAMPLEYLWRCYVAVARLLDGDLSKIVVLWG